MEHEIRITLPGLQDRPDMERVERTVDATGEIVVVRRSAIQATFPKLEEGHVYTLDDLTGWQVFFTVASVLPKSEIEARIQRIADSELAWHSLVVSRAVEAATAAGEALGETVGGVVGGFVGGVAAGAAKGAARNPWFIAIGVLLFAAIGGWVYYESTPVRAAARRRVPSPEPAPAGGAS